MSTPEKDGGISRWKFITNHGGTVSLPKLYDWDGAEEIAAALISAGPSEPGAMGDVPLSWQGIDAWVRLTESHLSPGDLEDMREMSAEYAAASHEYRGNSVSAPFSEQDASKPSVEMTRAAFRAARQKPPAPN